MKRMARLHGVLIPMIIPMFEDGSLDLPGTRKLAEKFLSLGSTNGLFALGATSEFMHLPFEERKTLIELLAAIDRGRKVITVNTGGLPIEEVLDLTRMAGRVGLDAAAVVVPGDVPAATEAVGDYFSRIDGAGVPFTVYWSPVASAHVPTLEVVDRLMEMRHFVGLKDSSRNMITFTDICVRYGSEISAFQGVEMLHLASLAVGSSGVVGGGLNLYPGLLAKITRAFEEANREKARELQKQVNESWDYLAKTKAFRSLCKQYWKSRGVLEGTFCREGLNVRLDAETLREVSMLAVL